MEKQSSNQVFLGISVFGAIFFIFGFATTFIVTLSAPVKEIFSLSEFEAQLLSSAFFIAYPLMSIPTGRLIDRIGYKWTVVAGLLLMSLGSFIYVPAARIPSFPIFLAATFVLATGVVFLQVAANPYVTAIGSPNTASSRLNFTQALNSIATMIAPWLISIAIFKGLQFPADAAVAAERVPMPFIFMGAIVLLVAIAIFAIKLPTLKSEKKEKKSIFKYPHVVLGGLAIFMYVGAEVGNAGLIVNYLKRSLGMEAEMASTYAAIYWGGAMVGRFFGSFMFSDLTSARKFTLALPVLLLALVSGAFVTDWSWNIGFIFMIVAAANFLIMQFGRGKAARTLATFALVAAILDIATTFTTGSVALWTIISIGLFNSIMFPNIFSLAVKDLDNAELSGASGLINALILGGAILPPLMGAIADTAGYTYAFLVPAVSYLFIFYYAVSGSKIRRKLADVIE
ncbi:MAG: MFS transporter [Bacteroidetes bacterium]|jgi:FHS family L-fucose permease-like MFS transporter|nr:MFS transporter [Bacteroidota bacterium]MBU1579391.1 MFS transporter [Bacteroidota bacterium]MBU2466170.1 MFS transporter [Bacteroidota bacterium]MBU2559155.1 MFS transporter [Bacteroidota bacterium]MDA3944511.1 MFS transporter [Bacteroidota bacterium]